MSGTTEFVIAIPARHDSQRLPGKALLDLHGKSLIQHVWERAVASDAQSVVIATDHPAIEAAAKGFGATVVMTAREHSSGSDRLAECARKQGWSADQIIVNLQGDEPLMPAACLSQVAELLARHATADAASLYWPVEDAEESLNPNVVKVVTAQDGRALMFSRAQLPYPRATSARWQRHLGLYAYRNASLQRFAQTAATPLERTERLEQLRYLETGGCIMMEQACLPIPPGVDTQEDLEHTRKVMANNIMYSG